MKQQKRNIFETTKLLRKEIEARDKKISKLVKSYKLIIVL